MSGPWQARPRPPWPPSSPRAARPIGDIRPRRPRMPVDTVSGVPASPRARVLAAERTSVVAFADVEVEVDRRGGVRFAPRGPWRGIKVDRPVTPVRLAPGPCPEHRPLEPTSNREEP